MTFAWGRKSDPLWWRVLEAGYVLLVSLGDLARIAIVDGARDVAWRVRSRRRRRL